MDIEAAMKRIPPHSIEAEQAVLGAMLMNKDAVMVASEMLTGEDFYQTAHSISSSWSRYSSGALQIRHSSRFKLLSPPTPAVRTAVPACGTSAPRPPAP